MEIPVASDAQDMYTVSVSALRSVSFAGQLSQNAPLRRLHCVRSTGSLGSSWAGAVLHFIVSFCCDAPTIHLQI